MQKRISKKVRIGLATVVAGTALVVTAPAFAKGHPTPPHGHIMLIGANQAELTYRKCVDLAGGKPVPLHAHHAGVHTGRAGEALAGAGNLVIPTADLAPHLPANCAGVDAFLDGMRNGQ